MEEAITIQVGENGFILNGTTVFEYQDDGESKQKALTRLLNRVLEDMNEDSWKVEVTG